MDGLGRSVPRRCAGHRRRGRGGEAEGRGHRERADRHRPHDRPHARSGATVRLRRCAERRPDRSARGGGRRGSRAGAARAADLDALGAVRRAVRAGLRGRLPGARQAAVPLRRADPQRRDDARPLPRGRTAPCTRRSGRPGSRPPAQHPDERPVRGPDGAARARARGSSTSSRRPTTHFHFFTAARYELEVPGAAAAGVGQDRLLHVRLVRHPGRRRRTGSGPPSRGATRRPTPSPASCGWGSRRAPPTATRSQREFQYVDITGLAPGAYRLRGVANPEGHVLEDDGEPDVTEEQRTIPGVTADPAAVTTAAGRAGGRRRLARARSRRRSPPARRRAAARGPRVDACYLRITRRHAADLRRRLRRRRTAAASFDGARLTYTPAAGFSGADSLTYIATDGRGLRQRARPRSTCRSRRRRPGAVPPGPRRSPPRAAAAAADRPRAPHGPPHARGPAALPPGGRRRLRGHARGPRSRGRRAGPRALRRARRGPPPHRHAAPRAAPPRAAPRRAPRDRARRGAGAGVRAPARAFRRSGA